MSKIIPSDVSPAIVFGAKLTTKSACLPSISLGSARSFFIPANMQRA
jgi:hypothetical protein